MGSAGSTIDTRRRVGRYRPTSGWLSGQPGEVLPFSTLRGEASGSLLVGRQHECAVLDELVSTVRRGRSKVLVVRGEPGIGKTTLLRYLCHHAPGCRVVSTTGVESEMELTYAGLQQLCEPFLAGLDRLPAPQQDALGVAFGLRAGDRPDRFLVGLAVSGLLSEAARERAVICVVDDAQWLDSASAQTLAFVARRLGAEAVAIVSAARVPSELSEVSDLPELVVEGLSDQDARTLLDAMVTGPLDEGIRTRFLSETRGNPLAMVQLPRGLTPEEVAGGFGEAGALTGRIEGSFRRRLESFPARTRQLLLVAAAHRGQDPVLVARAASHLGVGVEDAGPAIADGYVELEGQIRFCHPLARSMAYRTATTEERRTVHRLLAEVIDPAVDPDRRAWHRAQAVASLDEGVAADLEQSADRAQARGGVAAAASFLERAAELTPDPARRSQRALVAAEAKYQAAAPDRALRLLAITDAGPCEELTSARSQLLRAQIAGATGAGHDAPLLRAAKRLEPLDPSLARDTYRDAFYAALTAGRLAERGGMTEVAAAVRAVSPSPATAGAPGLLLDGLAGVVSDGYAVGAPVLQRAVAGFRAVDDVTDAVLSWLPLACRMSHDVWDEVSWCELSARLVQLARQRGSLSVLTTAILLGLGYHMFAGDIDAAAAMAEEAETVARATRTPLAPYGALSVAAWRGQADRTATLIAGATAEVTARGEGQWITAAAWATALVNNAVGRYDVALAAAERASEHLDELGLATWSMVELTEAAARLGSPERADRAMVRLSEIADACRTDWILGVHARLRGLISTDSSAEDSFREAIERLRRTAIRTELARAHLVYGEWLRRRSRRVDARHQLRAAWDMFAAMGLDGFAERARRELLATGETVRKRTVDTVIELTAQELQIARLAVSGRTNPEIGTQLFISPRTVEWHLRKVFAKLGVTSRRELRDALHESVAPSTSH